MSSGCAERQAWAAPHRAALANTNLKTLLDAVLGERARAPGLTGARPMIIDCHGHYTTHPDPHTKFRDAQLAHAKSAELPADRPGHQRRPDSRKHRAEPAEAGSATAVPTSPSSPPRASTMGHHEGTEAVSQEWTVACNDLGSAWWTSTRKTSSASCQLPQSPACPSPTPSAELERCVTELGFVGCNLNPDPSGGHWTVAAADGQALVPVLRKDGGAGRAQRWCTCPRSCNHNFHATGAHYINADTTAFMQFLQGDLFRDFPTLRFIIPHGGGAVPYHWGRYRGPRGHAEAPAAA
jgi:4-oxalmesaconate hydratase